MKKIIIIGGKGNGETIASLIEDINEAKPTWDLLGFFNDVDSSGEEIFGYPVIGCPEDMASTKFKDVYFIYALISLPYGKNNSERLEQFDIPIERFATLIHPTALISKNTEIGNGVAIMPMVHVRQNVKIGNHVTLLYGASVGHDTTIENYSFIGNNAILGSYNKVRKGVFIGTNATTIEKVILDNWCVVGIASVVIRNVSSEIVVAGHPAKFLKKRKFKQFIDQEVDN